MAPLFNILARWLKHDSEIRFLGSGTPASSKRGASL
jgi:hypothetical protein